MNHTTTSSLGIIVALTCSASLAFASQPYSVAAGDTEWQPYRQIWATPDAGAPQRSSWSIREFAVAPGDTDWAAYYRIADGGPSPQPTNRAEAYRLADGVILHAFGDGKMGMQDRSGAALSMTPGQPMVTEDGKTVIMIGNETVRISALQNEGNTGP